MVRLLLPDVIVFLGSLVTLVVNLSAVRLCRSEGVEGVGGGVSEGGEGGDTETQDGAKPGTGILNLYVHVFCVQFCTCMYTIHVHVHACTVQCNYMIVL